MPLSNGTWTAWELPNMSTNQTLLDIAKYNNSLMNDLFGLGILLSLFLIMLMIMSLYNSKVAIQSSMFITTVFGMIFAVVGLVGPTIPIIFMILTAASVALLWSDKK